MDKTEKDRQRKKCKVMGAIHNPEQFAGVIEGLKNCDFYAYIVHHSDVYTKKDYDEGNCKFLQVGQFKPEHLHFVAIDKNSKTWNGWADLLGVPSNMIQEMHNPRGMLRYLIHKDNPEKHQYDADEVTTNNVDRFLTCLQDEGNADVMSQYRLFVDLRKGGITPKEYIELNRGDIARIGFYQRLKLFSTVLDNYNLNNSKEALKCSTPNS